MKGLQELYIKTLIVGFFGNAMMGRGDGAEGESRTPTGIRPLDPEPSASTNSATSAR